MADWQWFKPIRRLIIGVVGATLLAIGVALLVLPGPGLLVIAGGLGVLAVEFVWARGLLRWARQRLQRRKQEPQGAAPVSPADEWPGAHLPGPPTHGLGRE